ncbi:patatin-like phospholipase family protein [Demequina sp. NBRC 110053]|uniref:patatin-like phospholipase family protein n=1 Tax=Demequina sp. NBRC 110053 TaxID=1570342 RepID=UPI0013564092|nr:patatin-like phospholipase family protein [Demequina sp. NBRC 110053]
MDAWDDLRGSDALGLALGGGGALGAAHVGVLQVLHERALVPTVIAGTSAGSIMGAAYAIGIDPYDLEERTVRAGWGTFGSFSARPGLGLLTADALRETVHRVAGDAAIEDLPVRFAAVATDIETRQAVVLDRGPLADAIAASIAVPGIFRPVRVGGRTLIDGGVVQNLPIETAFGLGADRVIAVRLAPEWDGMGVEPTALHVHEWVIRPDVTLIRPILERRSQWRPRDLPGMIELGRQAAERALADYPVVSERPERAEPVMPPEDEEMPEQPRGIARFLHRH